MASDRGDFALDSAAIPKGAPDESPASSKVERATEERPRKGFGALPKERHRELARRGGKSAHARGTAHEFSGVEAREAGRKGGAAISRDREYMSRIGREGARKSALVRAKPKPAAPDAPEQASPSEAKRAQEPAEEVNKDEATGS